MTRIVRDIMNPKLLYIREGDRLTLARTQIVKFGVTGVPILDDDHRPVGFVSLRDLASEEDRIHVSCPVATMLDTETVESGARKLAESHVHHMVVVDDSGCAVGMVSAIDFLRALTGLEATHPPRFDEPIRRVG